MANEFNIEEYIKDLTPEQQEKAKACKTKEELLQLAADEDMEIPMDALESVAGGCGDCEHSFAEVEKIEMSPYCGTNDKHIVYNGMKLLYLMTKTCSKCGESHYYYAPWENFQGGAIKPHYHEISKSEYNALKAQKTW